MPIPQRESKAARESAKEHVYRTLRGWIVDGTLAPGERISDQQAAAYFDVSRTPVREALQTLSGEGLVRVEPSRGTRVAPLDGKLAGSLYEALAALSGCLARLACEKQKEGDAGMLRQCNEDFRMAIERGEDGLPELDNLFHAALMRMADNVYLSDAARALTVHANRYENLYFQQGTDRMESVREHEAIIRAIEARDAGESGRCAEENWLGFYRRRLAGMLRPAGEGRA